MPMHTSSLTNRCAYVLFFSVLFFSNICYGDDKKSTQTIKTNRLQTLQEAENAQEIYGEQWVGTHLSFAGNSNAAIKKFDAAYEKNPAEAYDWANENLEVAKARVTDAIAEIVNAAKSRQIVILNEAHHVSMHRAFAMRLARELRKIGYEYLACEAFAANNLSPLSQGYVNYDSGFYTIEPMFANFLNDAINDQWKFVSFERKKDPSLSSSENSKLREITMAQNIIHNVLDQHPNAKIFIYTGYGHAWKTSANAEKLGIGTMASHLKKLSTFDPLSIDQTKLYDHFESQGQLELYENIIHSKKQTQPFIMKSPDQQFLRLAIPKSAVDMQITYPRYLIDQSTGRPEWMHLIADFKPHAIPQELIPTKGARLIYAYRKNDPFDAIPIDLVLIETGKPIPKLMLPEGEYRFAFEEYRTQ